MSKYNIALFPERLFALVDACALSVKEIAANVGVSAHMLERFMRGESLPKASIFCKICDLFHVRADYLLGADE